MDTPEQADGGAGTEPYRSSGPPRSFCHTCQDDRVADSCQRCGKSFCLEHLNHSAQRLCQECDDGLQRRKGRINKLVGGLAALSGGAGAAAVLLTGLTPIMAPFGLLLGVAVFAIAAPVAHHVSRKRFFKGAAPGGPLELADGALRIAAEGGPRGSRRTLSPRRGGHDPPGRPPNERFGYHG